MPPFIPKSFFYLVATSTKAHLNICAVLILATQTNTASQVRIYVMSFIQKAQKRKQLCGLSS